MGVAKCSSVPHTQRKNLDGTLSDEFSSQFVCFFSCAELCRPRGNLKICFVKYVNLIPPLQVKQCYDNHLKCNQLRSSRQDSMFSYLWTEAAEHEITNLLPFKEDKVLILAIILKLIKTHVTVSLQFQPGHSFVIWISNKMAAMDVCGDTFGIVFLLTHYTQTSGIIVHHLMATLPITAKHSLVLYKIVSKNSRTIILKIQTCVNHIIIHEYVLK